MVRDDLPFNDRTAQKLMAISDNAVISNTSHVTHLPPSWDSLYQLSRLDEETLTTAIEGCLLAKNTHCPILDRGLLAQRKGRPF
jgi:hypothetical protein